MSTEAVSAEGYGRYTNLHQHSIYSILDGFAQVKDIVKRCKALGMKGVALTDHGNCFGWYELHNACKKEKMKPIFGNEMYIAPGSALVKEKVEGYRSYYHLVVLAKNQVGLKNLQYLTTWSHTQGRYYKSRIDLSVLDKHKEGLIISQACIGGLIAQLYLEGNEEEAIDRVLEFKRIMGPDYYLEMQYSRLEEQLRVNEFFKKVSEKHDIPLIITADSHYTNREDSDFHAALVAINTKKKLNSDRITGNVASEVDDAGMHYSPHEYFIKSFDDLFPHFNDEASLQAFENTNKIADMCNAHLELGGKYIPKIKGVDNEDLALREMSYRGLEEYLNKKGASEETKAAYVGRLEYELDIIEKMEFSGYFLVVSEYTQWAKRNGIPVGPGRGSGAGSLVNYVLKITNVDPIKYGLLFGRFLNRGRAKRPLIEFSGYPLEQWA